MKLFVFAIFALMVIASVVAFPQPSGALLTPGIAIAAAPIAVAPAVAIGGPAWGHGGLGRGVWG